MPQVRSQGVSSIHTLTYRRNIWKEAHAIFAIISSHRHSLPCHTRGKEGGQNDRLDHGLHVLKPRSFPPNRAPKKQERHQFWLVSKEFKHSAIQTKIEQHFGGFFHQIKVRQPIGRQDSMQTWIQTRRRLDSFVHEAARNFEVFSNIQQ